VPELPGLSAAAEAHAGRLRRRRKVATAGIAAAATVALVLAAPLAITAALGEHRTGPPPAGSTTLVLAPEFEIPDFPFTPGWVPGGVSDAYLSYHPFGVVLAHYDLEHIDELRAARMVGVYSRDEAESMLDSEMQVPLMGGDEDEPGLSLAPLARETSLCGGRAPNCWPTMRRRG
jgi:hypothetical protein